MEEVKWVNVGYIAKPHGLKGELKVVPLVDIPDFFSPGRKVSILRTINYRYGWSRLYRELRINTEVEYSFKLGGSNIVVKLKGIDTIDQAEKLRGLYIQVERSELGELGEGQYYHFELVGLDVYTTEGEYLGRVEDIVDAGGGSMLFWVRGPGGKETYIPARKEWVVEVDKCSGRMVVKPMEYYGEE